MGLLSWLFRKQAPTPAPAPRKKAPAARVNPLSSATGLRVIGKGGYPRNVVGESNYQAALSKICGGHNRAGHELETVARVTPEPENEYDPNAVMVTIEDRKIGYLSRDDAPRYLEALSEAGHPGRTAIVAAKVVGGWRTNQHDSGHFGVKLAMPWPVRFEV